MHQQGKQYDETLPRQRTQQQQDEPFRHVFGTEHAVIEEQHQDFLANVAREADHG